MTYNYQKVMLKVIICKIICKPGLFTVLVVACLVIEHKDLVQILCGCSLKLGGPQSTKNDKIGLTPISNKKFGIIIFAYILANFYNIYRHP